MYLASGLHKLLIGIAPVTRTGPIEIVFGIGERESLQWLHED